MALEQNNLLTGADLQGSWRDYVQDASFRGVKFLVDGDDLAGGRRGLTHEFPYRDTPENEDLGHKAREYHITGYVIGDDWQRQRDQLIAALEQGGIAELVHPHYGIQKVWAKSYNVRHSSTRGREAAIEMTFMQEDRTRLHQDYPTVKLNITAATFSQYQAGATTIKASGSAKLEAWL